MQPASFCDLCLFFFLVYTSEDLSFSLEEHCAKYQPEREIRGGDRREDGEYFSCVSSFLRPNHPCSPLFSVVFPLLILGQSPSQMLLSCLPVTSSGLFALDVLASRHWGRTQTHKTKQL
uniref:Secreted protein n=1 Tax=Seriola dumerili TaxID=41447 RepID=A0A3B4VAV1_SERDU